MSEGVVITRRQTVVLRQGNRPSVILSGQPRQVIIARPPSNTPGGPGSPSWSTSQW